MCTNQALLLRRYCIDMREAFYSFFHDRLGAATASLHCKETYTFFETNIYFFMALVLCTQIHLRIHRFLTCCFCNALSGGARPWM